MKINFEWKENVLYVGDMSFGYVEIADYYNTGDMFLTTWMDYEELYEEFCTLDEAKKYLENKTAAFIEKIMKGITI